MKRTYLAVTGLALGAALLPPAATPPAVRAATFGSTPLDASHLAVLARPVGQHDWNLVVLEQLKPEPLCWQPRSDGLIDPALNRFDYTGICSRYLDSNGYSLRAGAEDQSPRFRLRLQQQGQELRLVAVSPEQPTELVIGRGQVPLRDRDGFVAITLENGWGLERRTFGSTNLNHVYFAHATPLPVLISQANGSAGLAPLPPKMPPPLIAGAGSGAGRDLASTGASFSPASLGPASDLGNGPIALQVIPFQGQAQ